MSHSYDNTLLQRMGFSDPDRRTPQHDDACIEIATDPERFIRAVKELRFLRNGRCELEVPLQKGEGKYASTVGFIDAMATYEIAKEDYSINKTRHFCNMGRSHEECVSVANRLRYELDAIKADCDNFFKKIHNFGNSYALFKSLDPSQKANWVTSHTENITKHIDDHKNCEGPSDVLGPATLSWWTCCALVEVKTRITAIGDLLRQMNLYREYKTSHGRDRHGPFDISDYVIWSLDPADARFTKLLAQQGYTLIAGPLP